MQPHWHESLCWFQMSRGPMKLVGNNDSHCATRGCPFDEGLFNVLPLSWNTNGKVDMIGMLTTLHAQSGESIWDVNRL